MSKVMKRLGIFCCACLLAACATVGEPGYALYDSEGDPLAMGMRFTTLYPDGWESRSRDEPGRTKMRSYLHHNEQYFYMLAYNAQEIDEAEVASFFDETLAADELMREWIKPFTMPGAEVLAVKRVDLGSVQAVQADFIVREGGGQGELNLASRTLIAVNNARIIAFSCSTAVRPDQPEALDSLHSQLLDGACSRWMGKLRFKE